MMTAVKQNLLVSGCIIGIIVLAGTACDLDTSGPRRTGEARFAGENFASRSMQNAGLAEAQAAADRVFRSRFRVDPAESTELVWVAQPAEVGAPEGTSTVGEEAGPETGIPEERPHQTVGDVLGVSPRRYRRVAELRLVPREEGVMAQVRVRLQRRINTERAAFARGRQAEDRPTETAIERMGATSPMARDEWRDYRRDRVMEQEILDAIQAELTTGSPAGN